jgi:DNA polymerase-3 subunit epsilon
MAKTKFNPEPHLGRAIVLDTETTGLSPKSGHKMVEIAAVELIDGCLTGSSFHAYVNPGRSVPQVAVDVHGLTTRFLRSKPSFELVCDKFLSFVGDRYTPIWAHSASFDERFVNAELEDALRGKLNNFQCSLKLARQILGKGNRKLENLAEMTGIKFTGRGAHSALADTEVLAKVLTQFLWPREIELSDDPSAAPAPERKKKTNVNGAAKKPDPTLALPDGFIPLTAETDARVCRYDEHDVNHLITSRGKRWSADEELRLADAFIKEQRSIIDLVTEHGRTPAALFMKLEALGVLAQGHPYTRLR